MPRKTEPRHLAFFLRQLERTGNITLAAEQSGLAKSGIHKRKRRDPAFAAACEQALAAYRSSNPPPVFRGRGTSQSRRRRMVEGASSQTTKTESGTLIPSHYAGQRQLRRLPAGRLTARGKDMLLDAIARTGNIRLAARHIGIAASSIHARRRADPGFERQLKAALALATSNVEAAIIQAADRTFGGGWVEGVDADGPPMTVGEMIRFLSRRP